MIVKFKITDLRLEVTQLNQSDHGLNLQLKIEVVQFHPQQEMSHQLSHLKFKNFKNSSKLKNKDQRTLKTRLREILRHSDNHIQKTLKL